MSWLKNWTSSAALTGESLSCPREVWCHCYACPQVTMWVLPPVRLRLGRACTALMEARSEWTQQSDPSRELKYGNQISAPLPVSWFRTRAVVEGDSDLFHCLPFPHSSKVVTDFTPHCHPASCHGASKPHMGRRASLLFCLLCTGDCKWALNVYLILYFRMYFFLVTAQKKRLKAGYDCNDALGQSPFILLP